MDATRSGGSGTAPQAAPVGSRITQATSPRASSASSAPAANGSATREIGLGGEPSGAAGSTGSDDAGARVVVPAMEVAGELDHAVAAREAARHAQGEQRRLGAAGGEAHALGRRHERHDALGPGRLLLAAGAEMQAPAGLAAHGLDHVGMGVAGDERAVPRHVVDETVPVEIPLVCALGVA